MKKTVQSPYSLRKVFKGASVYSIGEVLTKASGFFLIPLYTRILTPEDYGIVGYMQVFLHIATVVLAFGFHGAQTRYYYEHKNDDLAMGRFMFTINAVSILTGLLLFTPIVVIGWINKWQIGSSIPFHPYITVTLATVLFQVMAQNITAYYRARQQFSRTVALNISRFLLVTLASIVLVVVFRMGAFGRVAGLFIGVSLFIITTYWLYAKNFIWKFSREALLYAVSFGAPIVIHLLMTNIHNAIDRIILERFVTLDNLGIYTLGFTIGSAMQIFVTAFNQAYQPSFYQLMSSQRNDIEYQVQKTFKLWLFLITIIAVVGIVLGEPFLRIFAGPRFAKTVDVFPYIILAFFLGSFYFFFSSPIFYFKKTKWLPLITGSSAVINISLNFFLIPTYGIIGAAIATAISHGWNSLISLFVAKKFFKINWPYKWILTASFIVLSSLYFFN